MFNNRIMKILLSLLLLNTLSTLALAAPIIIGKDQAPINAHDYKILEKVATNAQIPIEKIRHLKRSDHFIVGAEGFLYRDRKKNGVVDGKDSAEFISITAPNSYLTDKEGYLVAIRIKMTGLNDVSILNDFKKIVAIQLSDNNINNINIEDLPELLFLSIFERNNLRTLTKIKDVNKLSYFSVSGLNTPNFKKFTGVKGLRKIDISGMGIESFDGLENMPNLKEAEISSNGEKTSKNFKSLSGIPKGHKLEKLKLSTSVTTDIKGIANFSHLKQLELWAGKRDLTDFTPLSKLKKLEKLEMTVSGINDFSFLSDMPKLKQIIIYHAPITSLEGLDEAKNLEVLELNKGKLENIEHLDDNVQLKTLILNDHNITKISGLERLKKLSVLDLTFNKISKIEGLDKNLCLEKFWVAGNPVNTFENIEHLPLLGEVGVDQTQISEFPNWQSLKRLHRLTVDIDQLNKEEFTPGYFYSFIPIKDFDIQMRQAKPVTDEERKQHGCM
jgi:hypothetical protein